MMSATPAARRRGARRRKSPNSTSARRPTGPGRAARRRPGTACSGDVTGVASVLAQPARAAADGPSAIASSPKNSSSSNAGSPTDRDRRRLVPADPVPAPRIASSGAATTSSTIVQVGDGAGDQADAVQRPAGRHQADGADQSAGRLEAEDAVEGRRHAAGAGRVGRHREAAPRRAPPPAPTRSSTRRRSGPGRRRCAAIGYGVRVPFRPVANWSRLVLPIRIAPASSSALDHRRGLGRHVGVARAGQRGRPAGDVDAVLDPERDAVQRQGRGIAASVRARRSGPAPVVSRPP